MLCSLVTLLPDAEPQPCTASTVSDSCRTHSVRNNPLVLALQNRAILRWHSVLNVADIAVIKVEFRLPLAWFTSFFSLATSIWKYHSFGLSKRMET